MSSTSLQAIQTKVRRITRSPSQAQLSDAQLNEYINTFVLYDFPEQLRTYNLRQPFSFTCNAFQDVYPTDINSFGGASSAQFNPLYDFQNKFISIHNPVYIAGFNAFYSQSREQFFSIYPFTNNITSISATGNGVTTSFSGVINSQQSIIPPGFNQQIALLQNNVVFSSVDINGNGISLIDSPILDATTGNPTNFGLMYVQNNPPVTLPLLLSAPYQSAAGFPSTNFINYVTGKFTITFPVAPTSGQLINSQTVPNIATRPQALLYFDNQITLRPIPDQPYLINFEVYKRPTELLTTNQSPDLNEWWQYIAYGAAKKIFEDKLDTESVQQIMPEFKLQERLVLRRTIVQNTNERSATIYTEQASMGAGYSGWWPGGPF